ncbi:MAG: proteasome-type protease [Parvularculaceae bacterium]|nr:proteasome-type protease [Parvularculaceae bacterium]
MTYCVGLKLNRGLLFMSDTRTNAGVDNISKYRKMFSWSRPGERWLTLMTSGNLATTQAVVSLLDEQAKSPGGASLLDAPTVFQAARLVGDVLREAIRTTTGEAAPDSESKFGATLILGGQIKGSEPRLFLIYPEGNFIEATSETPFYQTGETKYGRPILIRTYAADMTFEDAVRLLLISFDSTIKANLSVGLPLDLQILPKDAFRPSHEKRIEADDPYYRAVSRGWDDALKAAFHALPAYRMD